MDEDIFPQLTTKTVKSATASEIATVTEPIHLEQANIEALKQTILVNRATMRQDGGPIPGTQKIVHGQWDDGGATSEVVFTPNKGEVWTINAGSYASSGGTSRLFLFLKDNVSAGTPAMEIADESATSGQHNPLDPFAAPGFLIDENCSIVATVSVTNSTAENLYLSMSRVR